MQPTPTTHSLESQSSQSDAATGDRVADDAELQRIVDEEERVLQRVSRQIARRHEERQAPSGVDYNEELISLRDQIKEARLEDIPPLLQEMERIQQVASRRAKVREDSADPSSPYFGRLVLKQEGKKREVLVGRGTYLDPRTGIRIVDWRDAPVSRLYYRYEEGDDYEEEFGGTHVEGVIDVRRNLSISDAALHRIGAPQGTFVKHGAGWTRVEQSLLKLHGGQGSALLPESYHSGKRTGRLGTGAAQGARDEKYLPEITSLIDPRQFDLITKGDSGLVVIQGGAGSGKTTIGLHRMAYLSYQNPDRFRPSNMLVIVFQKALARYISRVLPALDVEGVAVSTYEDWAHQLRVSNVASLPCDYCDDTPGAVVRFKKHPLMLDLVEVFVERLRKLARAHIETTTHKLPVLQEALVQFDGHAKLALSEGVKKVVAWIDERAQRTNDAGAKHAAERLTQFAGERLSSVVELWAEMLSDRSLFNELVAKGLGDDFEKSELEEVFEWCRVKSTTLLAYLDDYQSEAAKEERSRDEDDGDAEPERVTIDREDDTLMLRLAQALTGHLRRPVSRSTSNRTPYEHVLVDEAQDLSPIELGVILDMVSKDQSVTLAGDVAQRMLMDNGFQGWRETLNYLGRTHVSVEPLRLAYRSTKEIVDFAREVLGPLADDEPMQVTRTGVPVEAFHFAHAGEAVAFLAGALRELTREEPKASVALITRYPEQADMYFQGLKNAEVANLRRVADQDFSFKAGIDVTDVRQVKGLEFDYVVLLEVSSASYPKQDEARHLLHIAATRAAHQLWVVMTQTPSELLPAATREHSI